MTVETKEISLPTLGGTPAAAGKPLFSGAEALPFLGGLKVRLTAQLGGTDITVAELTALQAGSTLALDRLLDQPIDLIAEGHVVAQGTLVAVGEHFGLRITAAPKAA